MFLASYNNFFLLPVAQFPKLFPHSVDFGFLQHATCIINFCISSGYLHRLCCSYKLTSADGRNNRSPGRAKERHGRVAVTLDLSRCWIGAEGFHTRSGHDWRRPFQPLQGCRFIARMGAIHFSILASSVPPLHLAWPIGRGAATQWLWVERSVDSAWTLVWARYYLSHGSPTKLIELLKSLDIRVLLGKMVEL